MKWSLFTMSESSLEVPQGPYIGPLRFSVFVYVVFFWELLSE